MGRKGVNWEQLNHWDHAWFTTWHQLAEGEPLPIRPLPRWFRYPQEPGGPAQRIDQLFGMSVEAYWADYLRLDPPVPRRPGWQPPPWASVRRHVEQLQHDEITWLRYAYDPGLQQVRSDGARIWAALWPADTLVTLADACHAWIQFEKQWHRTAPVTRPQQSPFPLRVLDQAQGFLDMKRDPRFPRSPHADSARRDYLARAMAGLEVGLSPRTAIERLRNLQHGPGGPLVRNHRCGCWRCVLLTEQDEFLARLEEPA